MSKLHRGLKKEPNRPIIERSKRDDYLKLQKQWYAKLKKSGFKDIEWSNSEAYNGQDSRYLLSRSNNRDPIQFQSTQNWYQLVQNYRTHAQTHPKTNLPIAKRDKILLDYYLEGYPYRKIIKLYQQEYTNRNVKRTRKTKKSLGKPRVSLYKLWELLNHHFDVVIEWNRTHPEGRLYGDSDSFYIEEVLINEDKLLKTSTTQ